MYNAIVNRLYPYMKETRAHQILFLSLPGPHVQLKELTQETIAPLVYFLRTIVTAERKTQGLLPKVKGGFYVTRLEVSVNLLMVQPVVDVVLCFETSLTKNPVDMAAVQKAWSPVMPNNPILIYRNSKMSWRDRWYRISGMLDQVKYGEPKLNVLVEQVNFHLNTVRFSVLTPQERLCLLLHLTYHDALQLVKFQSKKLFLKLGFLRGWYRHHKDETKPEGYPCECGADDFTTTTALTRVSNKTLQDLLDGIGRQRSKNSR